MNYIEALKIADSVFGRYKSDYPKMWKKIDGTPIENDIAVRMAVAFSAATGGYPNAAMADRVMLSDRVSGERNG